MLDLETVGDHSKYILSPSMMQKIFQPEAPIDMANIDTEDFTDSNQLTSEQISMLGNIPFIIDNNISVTDEMLNTLIQGTIAEGSYVVKISEDSCLLALHWDEIINNYPLGNLFDVVSFIPPELIPQTIGRLGLEQLLSNQIDNIELITSDFSNPDLEDGDRSSLLLSFTINPSLSDASGDIDGSRASILPKGWRPTMMCAMPWDLLLIIANETIEKPFPTS